MRFPFFRLSKSQPIYKSKKSQPIRKKLSQSDALISEVLERRQMLAADMTLYDVEFETMPANLSKLDANSYSLGWGQDGGNDQNNVLNNQWTSNNPVQPIVGDFLHRENIINSIDDFEKALKNQEVKEVSDDLIGVFYNQDDALYAKNLQRAWAGQSDNLYTLLQLNQRFPGATVLNPDTLTISYQISNMTMQAMMRVVGFPFEGEGPANRLLPSQAVEGPDNPEPNGYTLKWLIFSKKNQEFIETNPEGNPFIDWKGLNIEVPTIEHFFEFTNDPINGRDQSVQAATGGTPVGPLPSEVLVKLQNHYTDIGPTKKNVVEIFSEISGISNLSSLLLYPGLVNDINNQPVGGEHETLQNVQVYDAKNVQLQNQDAATINPTNYGIYQEASEDIGGYYNTWDTALLGSAGQRTQVQVTSFFNEFVAKRLSIIEGENNGETPNQTVINSTIDELAIGLRALMALAYDASPLWTGYGIGFANAANPMVGKTLSEIQSPDSFIDYFNGQEIQLRNILVPSKSLIVEAQDPLLGAQYTTYGWFDLHQHITLSGTDNYFDPQANQPGFRDNYKIGTSNSAVLFNPENLFSDTVSAAAIPDLSAGTLTPDSLINDNGSPKAIRDLEPIFSQVGLLPDNFATFISTAGGVDRVTGSKFSDVIVGPSHHAKHGRLTVSAGAGADVVIPGRGGSLVELGPDSDTIVIRRGDLFGTTNLLDFKASEDTIVYDKSTIKAFIDTNDANTLILTDRFGGSATKTLRLTPLNSGGDLYWKQEFLDNLFDSEQAGNFNYLETHNFIDSTITDLSNYSLRISSVINRNENPTQLREGDTVSTSIGDVQIFSTAQHDAQNDEIYVSVPLQEFITKGSDQGSDIAQKLISSEPFTVSVVPLRSVNSDLWISNGTFNESLTSAQLQADKGTTISITIDNVNNQDILRWFDQAGSAMYLFGDQGNIIGKAVALTVNQAGDEYVEVYVYDNTQTDASITTGSSIGWKYATEANSTAQQLQIFVTRENGWEGKFDKIHSHDQNKFHIKASEINAHINQQTNYNFSDIPPPNVTNTSVPFSEWRVLPGTQEIAYMGGLANYIYSNQLHYSSTDQGFRPIEITIDEDLFPGSGSGKVNLSSNFSVFTLPSNYDPATICQILNQYQRDSVETGNTDNNPTGKAYTLPTGMPDGTHFHGTYSLATKNQIFINGTGRINLANVTNRDSGITDLNSHPEYQYGAKNLQWAINDKGLTKVSNPHPDWASNIYYTIGTDIITASSTHKHDPTAHWAPAVTATGFTAAWPMIKGIGGVRFQEFDSIGLIKSTGVELRSGHEMRNLYSDFEFIYSHVWMQDFKQVGGWNFEADGPQIGGWGSHFNNSFIHANDDSLKFGAPVLKATNNTILQGSAGIAVGTSYGFVNGGFQGGIADGVFAHRVNTLPSYEQGDNAVGLVSAWASPVPEYFYDSVPQTLSVENAFVPNLQLPIYVNQTSEEWDLNHVSIGANVYFEDSVRGFPMKTNSQNDFSLQLGEIDMYQNWKINTHVVTPNTVAIGKTKVDATKEDTDWENTSINGTSPNAYHDYPAGLTSLKSNLLTGGNIWQMVQLSGETGPQWNNDIVQTPLYQSANSPTVTVTTVAPIKLFSQDGKLTRPELKRATKIRLNRDSNVIGPQPIRLMHSHIEDAVNANPSSGENHSYIVTNVASGKVEKKVGTTWIDVNAPLKTSSPLAMIAWLKNRMISAGDEIRYVVETEDQGEVTSRAFELIGWDGSSISEERTSVEIDASGWQDF